MASGVRWVWSMSALALAACTSRSPGSPTARQDAPAASEAPAVASAALASVPDARALRVATYNAGLAIGFIPRTTERAPRVVEALSSAELDLLCVQEFWHDEHWQQLVAASSSRLPHTHRQPAAASGSLSCAAAEVQPLRECMQQRCPGLTTDLLGACVLAQCASAAQRMSTGCINCLLSHPVGGEAEISARCVVPAAPTKARAAAARRSLHDGVVPYGGSFGTGLLSRTAPLERDAIVFPATLNPRGALYMKLSQPWLGRPLHAFCTHLTPGNEQEQAPQVEQLLDWITRKAAPGDPVVLLGDLNLGPAISPSIHPQSAPLYARILSAGFSDPYAEAPQPGCTFCRANPLNGGSGPAGSLIDHVLVRGYPGPAEGERWLHEPLLLREGGREVRTAYSDHYGLLVRLLPGRS